MFEAHFQKRKKHFVARIQQRHAAVESKLDAAIHGAAAKQIEIERDFNAGALQKTRAAKKNVQPVKDATSKAPPTGQAGASVQAATAFLRGSKSHALTWVPDLFDYSNNCRAYVARSRFIWSNCSLVISPSA